MDCWTFFEISLAFARMLNEPAEEWTPAKFLHYIELTVIAMVNAPAITFPVSIISKTGFTIMIDADWSLT